MTRSGTSTSMENMESCGSWKLANLYNQQLLTLSSEAFQPQLLSVASACMVGICVGYVELGIGFSLKKKKTGNWLLGLSFINSIESRDINFFTKTGRGFVHI